MTIPEDVREAMRQALEFCAGDYCMTGDRYDHFEAALAWLDAQPDAPEPDWKPVEVGAKIDALGSIECKVLYQMEEDVLAILTVDDNTVRGAEMLYLPDDVRLYRRMEATE